MQGTIEDPGGAISGFNVSYLGRAKLFLSIYIVKLVEVAYSLPFYIKSMVTPLKKDSRQHRDTECYVVQDTGIQRAAPLSGFLSEKS